MTDETQTIETQEQAKPLSLLARERFGDQYTGEVKEEPEEPETPEEPEAPEEPDEPEEPEVPEEEPEEPETPEEPEEPDEEGEPISSLDDLAEHFELDPEYVTSLKVKGKVDGEEVEFTLGELRDRAQQLAAADKRLEEAKAKREAATKEATQLNEQLQEQWSVTAGLIEQAEKLLDEDVSNINWTALREDDPAEYSAKKTEIAERRERIDKLKEEAKSRYQESVKAHQTHSQEQLQEYLAKEQEALLDKIPEWKDAETAKSEKGKLVSYLKQQGFGEQDIAQAADHRLIVLSRKAMLFDQGQANKATAKKKVAKVPKVVKPGATKPQDQARQENLNKHRARLKKSGSLDDAYAFLKARKA